MNKNFWYIKKDSWPAWIAAFFMAVALVLRLNYYTLDGVSVNAFTLWWLIVTPCLCNILYALFILLWGDKRLWLTAFPVLLGCLFFILKAGEFVWWQRILCTLLYLAVGALYTLTVLGVLKSKLYVLLVFGLPLAFHIVQDVFTTANKAPAPVWGGWLPELSVLCIMAALLCASVGFCLSKKS